MSATKKTPHMSSDEHKVILDPTTSKGKFPHPIMGIDPHMFDGIHPKLRKFEPSVIWSIIKTHSTNCAMVSSYNSKLSEYENSGVADNMIIELRKNGALYKEFKASLNTDDTSNSKYVYFIYNVNENLLIDIVKKYTKSNILLKVKDYISLINMDTNERISMKYNDKNACSIFKKMLKNFYNNMINNCFEKTYAGQFGLYKVTSNPWLSFSVKDVYKTKLYRVY